MKKVHAHNPSQHQHQHPNQNTVMITPTAHPQSGVVIITHPHAPMPHSFFQPAQQGPHYYTPPHQNPSQHHHPH